MTALPCPDYKTEELVLLLSDQIYIVLLVFIIYCYNTNGATLQPTTWPAQPPMKPAAG